jgi:hypothetical protein
VAADRFPDAVEATLDTGEATIRNAAAVMAATDGNLDRSRAVLAGVDDTVDRVTRVLDAPAG